MTLDPGPPRRNPSGGLGAAAPQWVWVPVPGPRRDMDLGNISRVLENVADSDFQYFQESRNTEKLRFPIFTGFWE